MLTLRSILCPVDFSDQSREALRWAAAIAARYQSRLTVLTAVDPLLAQAAQARLGVDLASAETEPQLSDFVRNAFTATASSAPDVVLDVRVGEAPEVILEAAERLRADLIAMGTQGIGGLRKLLMGSTTERVLRSTRVPLLALPLMDARMVTLDAAGPRLNIKTILLATDFSEAAADATQWAGELAQQLNARLVVAHVVAPELAPPSQADVADGDDVAAAREQLEASSARLAPGLERDIVVAVGQPADSIASIAQERHAGLIVVGRTGQRRMLAPQPGSIAYRIVGLARVPVLVVPPRARS